MQRRSMIFVVASVLLVPFVYGISVVPGICAAPMAPGFSTSGNCDVSPKTSSGSSATCCWREDVPGQILSERYCQTCHYGPDGRLTSCDDKELQYMGKPPAPKADSGVLQDPSTGSDPKASEGGFLGDLKNKITSSESNTSSSNVTK